MSVDNQTQRIESLESSVKSLHSKMDDVLVALTGDSLGTSTGMVKDMAKMKDDIGELKDFKKKLVGIAAALVIAFQIGYAYVKDFFLKGSS